MYHDQGHIPLKLLGFNSGVNVTLGLPFTRTSVDHGTAFEIAWQGKAMKIVWFTQLNSLNDSPHKLIVNMAGMTDLYTFVI